MKMLVLTLLWLPVTVMAQGSDINRALEVVNKVQRTIQSLPPARPAPEQAPAPAQEAASKAAPRLPREAAARPVTSPSPQVSASTIGGNDPGFVFTHQPKSKLKPGQRIEHDPMQPPRKTAEWAPNHDNFAPPEASIRYADGPRTVMMNAAGAGAPIPIKRVLSNPYIPTERIDLPNPNWVISPYYQQGFFAAIEDWSCRPDGTLFVKGKVGPAADTSRGQTFAKGIWRVAPDGQILAHAVYPDSSYLKLTRPARCERVDTCELPPSPARERALAAGSKTFAEDRHGNVWGISGDRRNKACFVRRFNADGSETTIRSNEQLCAEDLYHDNLLPPHQIVYDKGRDEVVFSTSFWGAGNGMQGLFRVNQAGEVTELLRAYYPRNPPNYKAGGPFSSPPPGHQRSPNQPPGRWTGLDALVLLPHGAIGFETHINNEVFSNPQTHRGNPMAYLGRIYEIRDSFKTLKLLPYSVNDRQLPKDLHADDQLLWPDLLDHSTMPGPTLGHRACYDDAGNRYFSSGGASNRLSIRKMDPQGRLSTWLH